MRSDSSISTADRPQGAAGTLRDEHDMAVSESATRVNTTPSTRPSSPFVNFKGRAVLLTMDGSAPAAAGARVAVELAARYGAVVHVLRVIDSRSLPFPPAMDLALAIEDPDRDLTMHQKEVQDVRSWLDTIAGRIIDWPIRVTIGAPIVSIVDEARRIGAALVIVGLHKYGRIDRALNNETALNVMRKCGCPVLGVSPELQALPVRILSATDFTPASLAAARVASALSANQAALVLAYVPPITALLGDDGERRIHDLGVRAAFADAGRELGDGGVSFEHVVLPHELSVSTAASILEYAEQMHCDLIAAGSASHGRIERWMTGSVSTELVRDGTRSVLVVPPSWI